MKVVETLRLCILMIAITGITDGRMYKLGLLAPFSPEYDFSALTSASAVSVAIDNVHSNPLLNADGQIQLRFDQFLDSNTTQGNKSSFWCRYNSGN